MFIVCVAAAGLSDSDDSGGGGELRKFRLRWSCRRALPRPRSEPPLLPKEDGVEEDDDTESGVADDVGEVDDESLLLLSIVVGVDVAVALVECCSFIRIHLCTGFAFLFLASTYFALFLETITLSLLIAFVFLSFSFSSRFAALLPRRNGTGFKIMLFCTPPLLTRGLFSHRLHLFTLLIVLI